jgi:hypothetical protein
MFLYTVAKEMLGRNVPADRFKSSLWSRISSHSEAPISICPGRCPE